MTEYPNQRKYPNKSKIITRPHRVGKSMALTLNPDCVRTLGITEETILVQKIVSGGLMLEMCQISPMVTPKKDSGRK